MKVHTVFFYPFLFALACQGAPPGKSSPAPEKRSAGGRLTLSAATELALANNPAIHEARARWEAMKARVPQAAAWDDLKVSGSTRLGRFVEIPPNGFADQMLSVEQMIPVSGKNQSRARIAAAEALGGWEEVRRKEFDVIAKVRASWCRLAGHYALLELLRANESSLHQTVEISRAKFEVGGRTQTSVLVAETEASRLEEARHDLLRSVSEDETQLNGLMDRDAFTPIGRPADATPLYPAGSADRLRAVILGNRPELRKAQAAVTAGAAKVELARREWFPDPTVSVQAQRYNEASQVVSEVSGGVSFSVPWLNGKKYRAEEREAEAGAEAARRSLESAQSEALGMLRDQLRKIETLRHHVELFHDRLLPKARQTFESSQTDYEGDKTGFLELVTAQRNLRDLESLARQHLIDYQVALAELEAITGADLRIFGSPPGSNRSGTK